MGDSPGCGMRPAFAVSTVIPLPSFESDRQRVERLRDDLEAVLVWYGTEWVAFATDHATAWTSRCDDGDAGPSDAETALSAVLRHHDLYDSRVTCRLGNNPAAKLARGELLAEVAVALRAGEWIRIPCRLYGRGAA